MSVEDLRAKVTPHAYYLMNIKYCLWNWATPCYVVCVLFFWSGFYLLIDVLTAMRCNSSLLTVYLVKKERNSAGICSGIYHIWGLYLLWSVCALYLLSCHIVSVRDSGMLLCPLPVERSYFLLCVDQYWQDRYNIFNDCFAFVQEQKSCMLSGIKLLLFISKWRFLFIYFF